MGEPCVFFDRDGTLIQDVGYLDRLDRIEIFPDSIDAVRLVRRAGFRVVVVTNQAGVARGLFPETFVHDTHRYLADVFEAGGARIDAFYYCPHYAHATLETYRLICECRKPAPGMLRRAERELGVDLTRSVVVGDRWIDVEMAQAVGAQAILVRTGGGATEEQNPKPGVTADAIVDHVIQAVGWVIRQRG